MATSENPEIKACVRDKSGVYIKVNEHFVEGAQCEFGVFGGRLIRILSLRIVIGGRVP